MITAAALLVTVTACSHTSAPATRAADQHFVDGVHESATDIGRYRSDSQLLKLGHATCDGFRADANLQQIASLLESGAGPSLPPEDVGAVMSTAVTGLCPSYAGRINPVPTGG